MKTTKITLVIDTLEENMRQLPILLGNVAVEFFKEGIDNQQDIHGRPYTPRKYTTNRQKGKRILKDRHNLYDGIRILSISEREVTVGIEGAEVPYAEAHNEGAVIPISGQMKKFFWAMAKKNKGNADGAFYENLARKKTPIVIPKREFIGNTITLEKKLEEAIINAFRNM